MRNCLCGGTTLNRRFYRTFVVRLGQYNFQNRLNNEQVIIWQLLASFLGLFTRLGQTLFSFLRHVCWRNYSFPAPLIPMEQWPLPQHGSRLRLGKSHLHLQQKEGMPKGVNCFLKTRNEDPLMLIVEKQLKMSHLNQLVKSHLKQLIMSNLKHQLWRSQLNPSQRGCVFHHHLNQQTLILMIMVVVISPKRYGWIKFLL